MHIFLDFHSWLGMSYLLGTRINDFNNWACLKLLWSLHFSPSRMLCVLFFYFFLFFLFVLIFRILFIFFLGRGIPGSWPTRMSGAPYLSCTTLGPVIFITVLIINYAIQRRLIWVTISIICRFSLKEKKNYVRPNLTS